MEEGQASACFSAGQAYARRALQFGHLQKVMLGILRPEDRRGRRTQPSPGFQPWAESCSPFGAGPKGHDTAHCFNPISANLIKSSAGRMYFVPEGQHDRSQARSAWSHQKNWPVPAGRLNGSRLGLEANKGWIFGPDPPDFAGRDGGFASIPRHIVPGYSHLVPPGLALRAVSITAAKHMRRFIAALATP
jgi:hypothetical protein